MLQSIQLAFITAVLALATAPASAQSGGAVHIVRYIDVAPDSRLVVPRLLKALADESLKEAGAVRFEVVQRTAPASQFATIEEWKDQQSLDAHMGAARTKQFLDQMGQYLIAPIDTRTCAALDVVPPPEGRIRRGRRYIITHVDVNPPTKDQAIEALKTLAAASRKEEENIRFDVLAQNVRSGNHFELIEIWRNQKADDAHEIAAQTKDFRKTLAPLTGALYDQRWYRPL
jgi:quinol monooxygenase YgiN